MKKLLAVLIILLALCACSNKTNDENTPEWAKNLGQENIISIGTSPDYPPYESLDTNGNIVGFEYDFMNEVIKIFNEQNNTNYELEWVQMEFDTIISAVQINNVDIGVSGFTWDEDRVGQVLFSSSYTDCGIVAVVPKDSDIKTLTDLEGKAIGAQMGTTCADAAQAIADTDVSLIKDVNVLMANFSSGSYDAVVIDKPVAQAYCDANGFVMLDESIEDNATYVITATNNEALINQLNKAIDEFKTTAKYDELQVAWGLK